MLTMRRQNAITPTTPSEKSVVRSENQPVKNDFQSRALASVTGAGCTAVVVCRDAEGVIPLSPYRFSKGKIYRLNFSYGVIWKLIYNLQGE